MSKPLPTPKPFLRLLQFTLTATLLLVIVGNTVLFFSWQPVVNVLYSAAVDSDNSLGTISQRTQLVTQTLQYLRSPLVTEWQLVTNNQVLPLTLNERQHMADVKQLLLTVKILTRVSTLALIAAIVLTFRLNKKLLKQTLEQISKLLLILPASFLIGVLFFWNFSFTLFHQLLFAQGNWAFPADSTIIQLFPEQFWIVIFVSYLGILMGIGGIMKISNNSFPSSEGRTSSEHLVE